MLIEFSITNFRSIRERQSLNLVASKADKELPHCRIERDLPGLSGLSYLKGAALYGANASGKTNILQALAFLAGFVRDSAVSIKPGEPTGTQAFKLDAESIHSPSVFETRFVDKTGVRFEYLVSLDSHRVLEESLTAFPKGLPRKWYQRRYDAKAQNYDWSKSSAAFKMDKDLMEKTRDNCLFLSTAAQFNHEQLTPVYQWFAKSLHYVQLRLDMITVSRVSLECLQEAGFRDRMVELLRLADTGIVNAEVEEKPLTDNEIRDMANMGGPFFAAAYTKATGNIKMPVLSHQAKGGQSVRLRYLDEESAGTRAFFALIGPWLDIMEKGYVVLIDELEASLHPLLVRALLEIFFSDKHNRNGAQIIFTTHNPVFLDSTLLRRDQIWLTEKNPEGATELYPLTDYKPRKDEALGKGYLAGRYGGVPFIPDGLMP
jgi:AAA15 family ATPase/GTPase